MANQIEPKILLKNWFQSGDAPTEDQFDDLITSLTGNISEEFEDTDIVDGILTIDYGSTAIEVDGAEVTVDVTISYPLFCVIINGGGETMIFPVKKITTKQCTVNIGSKLPTGTYIYNLIYNL